MAARKLWTLLGHSNGEGYAGASPMFVAAPWLKDKWANLSNTTTAGQMTPAMLGSVYKNLYTWTAKSGWPLSGGTPPTFTPGAGTWLEMTAIANSSPGLPHPYSSPYNYPNTRSMPTTPTWYQASTTGGRCQMGIELPLSWRLSHYWLEAVYLQKLSIPTTFFLRFDPGITLFDGEALGVNFSPRGLSTHYSWLTPADQWDWDPSTERLYATWKARMTAAAAEADSEGDTLDTRLVVLWMGDNDSALIGGTEYEVDFATSRVKDFERYYRLFIDKVRSDLVDNGWTTLPKHKIVVVGMGIFRTYGLTIIRDGIEAALENIANDDPYFKIVPTADMQTLASAGYTDAVIGTSTHLSHLAYLEAADAIFDAFVEAEVLAEDALNNENRVSVSTVKDRVGIYYERNRTRNDATDAAMLQHINGALFHILNRVGDNAWWLRRIYPITMTAGPSTPVNLPRYVHRILRVESQAEPNYPLHFEQLGFTDEGRMQILMKERYTGTFNVHFITQPKELTQDQELIPLPYQMIEWLVVEATRRLARSSGNIALQQALMEEARELMADGMRNSNAVRRPARDRLFGQRRLADRRSYRRRGYGP